MYRVIRAFRDLKNNEHYYAVGDTYPVAGYKPANARIDELVKGTNANGHVYLEKIEEKPSKKAPKTAEIKE
jgi:hypothetical protein